MNTFNLRNFLTENSLTSNSRVLNVILQELKAKPSELDITKGFNLTGFEEYDYNEDDFDYEDDYRELIYDDFTYKVYWVGEGGNDFSVQLKIHNKLFIRLLDVDSRDVVHGTPITANEVKTDDYYGKVNPLPMSVYEAIAEAINKERL